MARYTSNRFKDIVIGLPNYSELKTALQVVGRVGIGTTMPEGKLQVGVRENSVIFTDPASGITSVGIGSTNPWHRFQVNAEDDIFVIDQFGRVGIGSTFPDQIPGYAANVEGDIKLNVEGTV